MDHHFLPPHHTSHTPQISHPSSQHGQLSQHQQPLSRPPFTESNPTIQQQPQQGHGQGSQLQAQQGQGQQPPQIRSRITVVCAECKRLKLRCDRRAPCGSCTKRDTVQRCIYSPAAAEKVDLHSLNNRLIQVEAALAMITSGQFESVYPGVRELVDNVRVMGSLVTGGGSVGSSGQVGCVGVHRGSTPGQGGRAEGYREQQAQGPQGQSLPLETNLHPQTAGDNDSDPHQFSHQHTHQHHHHQGTATSQTYSASSSFKALARDCARAIDPYSALNQGADGDQAKRGTASDESSRAQMQFIKLEPSPSDLGFEGSRSPSPIPFFAPTSHSTSTSNNTVPPSSYTSNSSTAPPILLPALSIYYPLPTIPPPGFTEPEARDPSFSGGTYTSTPTHTTANSSHPQITSALLALLPTGERCLRWLELAEKVISVRGLPLEFESSCDPQPQNDDSDQSESEHLQQAKEKTAWESFEERCWPLIGAQGKPRTSEGEKKERTRHRERERRRERDRDKPPGSTASSPTTSCANKEAEQRDNDSARERNLKEQEREKARRARQIYFGGLAGAPGDSGIPSGMPRRRAIGEYRERGGLSPSPGSSGNEHRVASPPLFRPPGRREYVASIPFYQALSTPKRDEPLSFFALMCTMLAIGGITERAQTTKQAKSDDSSALPGSSTSSTNILQAMDASPSPEFLYALGRQALGVWDTQISSSSSFPFRSSEKEKQKLEYILTCCAEANYVLLGLELGVRPDRDGLFGGGEDADGEGLGGGLADEVEQQRLSGRGSEEEERMHEESSRRKAGRIIYGLVGKMVNAGRAMGLANDSDLRSQSSTLIKQESDYSLSTGATKFGRDEWKRAIWWEIMFWDLFVADVFNHQAYISPGSYTTRLPGATMPPQTELETAQRFMTNHADQRRDLAPSQFPDKHRAPTQKAGDWGMSAEYLVSRYRLTSLTQSVQARLARPDCCCGYTLDQASTIETEVRTFLAHLPEPLKVSSHTRTFDCDGPASTHHEPESLLKQMQAYELAIVANTLLLGIYSPFISSPSNTPSATASTRRPSAFGSTLLPSTVSGKSVMDVGSSLPPGLANNGNIHASSHATLTLQPTHNAISAASAKSASNVMQNDSNLGGRAGSGASVDFANTTIIQSGATTNISGTYADVNPSSGPGGATSADSVTLGSAGSGMNRRGREVEIADGNSSGVIDMPRLGKHSHVNTLAIHASVRAAKSIVNLFENLRDIILDVKSTSNTVLVVPALFIFYPPPTTLLHTLVVLARAQGDFCSTTYPFQDSWSGIADSQELLSVIETALSIIDGGNYWTDRLCQDDQRLLDWIRKKTGDIRNFTELDSSTRLTMDAMARFNAEGHNDATEPMATIGIQHVPHGLKRKHSQVSVGSGAANGSRARTFDHEFNLDDANIDSLPNTSGVNGSAGGRVGEVMMEVMTGSGSNPHFDFGAMERHQGAQINMAEHQNQSSPALPQSDFVHSERMRHQEYSLPTFEHKLSDDHPIAQQQHHPFTDEMGAPHHPYGQDRQKSPALQHYSYLDSHASRPHETLSDRLTNQRREKIQEQLQREREMHASEDSEKERERKSSSGSSSSRKSVLPTIGIRLRFGRDSHLIAGSTHPSTNSRKNNEATSTPITPYSQHKIQESGAYGQPQHVDGSMTGPSSPVVGFRSRSASLNQANQAQMQIHYDQQHSALQQQQDLGSQQHMDFSSLTMSHSIPLSSRTEDFSLDPVPKKSYDSMHLSERSTPAQSQPPPFATQPSPFSPHTYDQSASQNMRNVFDSPQPPSQYERTVEHTNTSSNMASYHSNSSPFTNANGVPSASGSPFPMNSSGHPTPTFPSHHSTPPIFGTAPPPSTSHPSPVNFFHNQFSGHESVSYANSPVSSSNLPHQHPQPTIHHQPQPLQSQRNALMDMQLDRMEHSMLASIPGTPVYEETQLQPLDSFDSKTGVVISEMHGMGPHNMSEQTDISAGIGGSTVWGNRGSGTSTMSVEHHHHQQLNHRLQQDVASQNTYWNSNADLKFYQ